MQKDKQHRLTLVMLGCLFTVPVVINHIFFTIIGGAGLLGLILAIIFTWGCAYATTELLNIRVVRIKR